MTAIISLLPIFGYASIFYIFFKKTVSVSIFFAISSIISILFLCGMADFLKYGTYLLFYGGIGLLLLLSIWFKDKLFEAVKSVPFVMFTLMSIVYLYLMQDAQLFFWDEYSHWGAFIKEMYHFHHFYDTSSVAAHLNYPPGISIWDYFIVLPTGFTEGKLYFAYFLILFSSTLMMYERLSFKQVHWVILVFVVQMVVFAGFGHGFSSIYVDHVIGAMFAGLVLTYLADDFDGKQFILFVFPLTAIVLIKEIGLYFGFASIGLMLILQISRFKLESGESLLFSIKEQKRAFVILSIVAVSMLLVLKTWGIRQDSLGVKKELQTISGITKSIFSDQKVLADNIETEVKKRFWEVVFYQQLHKEQVSLSFNEFSYGIMSNYKSVIKLSTIGSVIFFIFMYLVAYFTISSRDTKIEMSIIAGYMLLISIVYLFILYFSYLVAFGNGALRIPSYVRYMNMSILPLIFVGFMFLLPFFQSKEYFRGKSKDKRQLFLGSLVVIIMLVFITRPYLKPLCFQVKNPIRDNIDRAAENILQIVPSRSNLLVVFPMKNNGSINNILKYSLIPARATISQNDFSQKTSEEMIDQFINYEYIWFAALNQDLVNKNKDFLRAKSKNELYTLYKVENKNNKVNFKPIQ